MANAYWVGGAPAINDVWELTLALIWAANDIARVTIGTKDLLLTVGSGTLQAIRDELVASINAVSATSPTPASSFTRNVGGQQIAEFTEAYAEAHPTDTAKLYIKSSEAGVPIGVTAGETTVGTGTLTAVNTTVATGPWHLDNADNWLAGTLPVDNDVLIWDRGNVPVLYGLTYLRTNLIDADWDIYNSWGGQMGLPVTRAGAGYQEYRQRFIQYKGELGKKLRFLGGSEPNNSPGQVWINMQDQASVAVEVLVGRGTPSTPNIFITGAHSVTPMSSFTMKGGNVHIEPPDAAPASGNGFFATLWTVGSGTGNDQSQCNLIIGSQAKIGGAAYAFYVVGATVTIDDDVSNNIFTVTSGTLELRACTVFATINVGANGKLVINTSTQITGWGSINCYGGEVDVSKCADINSVGASVRLFAGSKLNFPQVNGLLKVILDGCTWNQVTAVTPPNRTWDLSAVA